MSKQIHISENLKSYATHPITGSKDGNKIFLHTESRFEDSATDAFSRLRVSNPATIFDSQSEYDKQDLIWAEKLTAGGTSTHLPNESAISLAVTAANGDEVIRQTREYFRYQPGKSQQIILTYAFGATLANTEKRVGYFDANNGIFLLNRGGNLFIVKRSFISGAAVDTEIAQSSWNLDKLDGTGVSGITLDETKVNIFVIDLEWLGSGRVRTSFNINGKNYCAHEFSHANIADTTYMTTANLPVRYQITTTALNTGVDSFKKICCSVVSEGGVQNLTGYPFSIGNIVTRVTGAAAELPVIAIRPKATFNGIVNRSKIMDVLFNALAGGADHIIQVYYNPAIADGAWVSADADSAFEYNITGTAIVGGHPIRTIYIANAVGIAKSANNSIDALRKLPVCLDIDGANPIIIAVTARTLAGAGTAAASLDWTEIR